MYINQKKLDDYLYTEHTISAIFDFLKNLNFTYHCFPIAIGLD